MSEDQVRFIPRSKHTWREPTLVERLEIIQAQIKKLGKDFIPKTDAEVELVVRLFERENALLIEIKTELNDATT